MFDDLIDANKRYAAKFHDPGVAGTAARRPGGPHLHRLPHRSAGDARPQTRRRQDHSQRRRARDRRRVAFADPATNLLDVKRICVVQHTDCAMARSSEEEIAKKVADASGADASGMHFLAMRIRPRRSPRTSRSCAPTRSSRSPPRSPASSSTCARASSRPPISRASGSCAPSSASRKHLAVQAAAVADDGMPLARSRDGTAR